MRAWRLFEIKDNQPHTLFHGVDGSRRLQVGKWYDADVRLVYDGSNRREYLSGFHVFADEHTANRYHQRFTAPRDIRVLEIEVERVRPKPTNGDVLLAERMRIT
jgi:hypothetical protein